VLKKLGILLFILSFVFYALILMIPLLAVSLQTKTLITALLVIAGEISFWSGGLILGKEVIRKYRRFLNPKNWFARQK
jgi:hypothetical protein